MIDLVTFEDHMTGQKYLKLLQNTLSEQLEDILLATWPCYNIFSMTESLLIIHDL